MKILRNILFYILFFLVGFFLGIQVATIVEAGKHQMLAGGAIVFGYGIVGAIIGLTVSILLSIVYKTKPRVIIILNKVLVFLLILLMIFFYIKYEKREAQKNKQLGYQLGLLATPHYSSITEKPIIDYGIVNVLYNDTTRGTKAV